ncbi:NAD(P)/FAD-dependent oxidoreductase [Patescibacteria group bacterium]|nr:NAD(P)/FAD-dependent oxidoreductase [Patescibacteria group bacterium]MCG2696387.1 NAD(P)/FAD-dependent oxidoreductase [Candidatus Portnoybacteria bacterium]
MVDFLIIGGGPAGIAAGIYACQDKANFLLIEEKQNCWFMKESVNSHYFVDGFTGSKKKVTGSDLQRKFMKHYLRLGGGTLKEKVLSLNKKNNKFVVKTNKSNIYAETVILASGTKPKKLYIDNINRFKDQIHFDCTIDGKKYINKNIIVVGGRNSGSVAACYLYDLGCKPTLLELQKELPAKDKYQKWLAQRKIRILTSAKLVKIWGEKKLQQAVVKLDKQDKIINIATTGIFVYIGRQANLDFLKIHLKKNKEGHLLVNYFNQTSCSGLFAAGDVTCKLKQIITACGDGANAYYFAKKYLESKLK